MNCPICKKDNFENLDHLRDHSYWYDKGLRYDEPVGFKICKNCGFCCYDHVKGLDEIYDNQRKFIAADNIVTCNRKAMYHRKFLEGHIKPDWKALDIGCAQGYLLNLYHEVFGLSKQKLYGTEFSSSCRNYAQNVYGIETGPEKPEGLKSYFDFVSYYHVLEHIQEPDKELEEIRNLLADDGLLYISVPVWFNCLEEASGAICADFENLFHVNHLNVFSVQSLKNLLSVSGFEIIKIETQVYGYTILCKKAEKGKYKKEDWKQQLEIIEKQKKAIESFQQKKFAEAVEIYPNYPDAYIMEAMRKENVRELKTQLDILRSGLEATGDHLKIKEHIALVLLQWDEQNVGNRNGGLSNNVRKSEELFKEVHAIRNSEQALFFLGIIAGKYKKDYLDGADYMRQVLKINPTRFSEIHNFIGQFLSHEQEAPKEKTHA